jgi:hypothetical protein
MHIKHPTNIAMGLGGQLLKTETKMSQTVSTMEFWTLEKTSCMHFWSAISAISSSLQRVVAFSGHHAGYVAVAGSASRGSGVERTVHPQ